MTTRIIGGLVALTLCGCFFGPRQLDGLRCDQGSCAEGYVCVDDICVLGNTANDAGGSRLDAGKPSDGGAVDAGQHTATDAGVDSGAVLDGGTDGGPVVLDGGSDAGAVNRVEPRVTRGLAGLYEFQPDAPFAETSGTTAEDLVLVSQTGVDEVEVVDAGLALVGGGEVLGSPSVPNILTTCEASNAITVEAWVTPAVASVEGPQRIFALRPDRDAPDAAFMLGLGTDEGAAGDRFTFRLRTSSSNIAGRPGSETTLGTASTFTTHVVFTYDGSETKAFLNGQLVSNTDVIAGPIDFDEAEDHAFFVGGVPVEIANQTRRFKGEIHLVAVYCTALTQDEVQQNFMHGKRHQARVPEPDLHYEFNTGSGDTVFDRTTFVPPLNGIITTPTSSEWVNGGLTILNTNIRVGQATRLFDTCRISSALTVEAWVEPFAAVAGGPDRIITYEDDNLAGNFLLGYGFNSAIPEPVVTARVRRADTSPNGLPAMVFEHPGARLQHIAFTLDASNEVGRTFVDGVEVPFELRSSSVEDAGFRGDFSTWTNSAQLRLGNSLTETPERQFSGTYYDVAVYCRALSPQEIANNYGAGPRATAP